MNTKSQFRQFLAAFVLIFVLLRGISLLWIGVVVICLALVFAAGRMFLSPAEESGFKRLQSELICRKTQ